jgi:TonB family protein
VQGSTDVPYPVGAVGDATVLLELEIDKQGRVWSAAVREGSEPFAEQARRAALEWRFSPALRSNVPVAARIRARVQFHQDAPDAAPPNPRAPAATSEAPSALAAQQAPSVPAVPVEPADSAEIIVRGTRRELGQTTLSAGDVREMPGAFGDPFRAIEALPGVTPVVSGLPFFYIRGAPPNDNGFFVDGIRVPLLFHVGIGEGVIHPALIDHVDFYPGAAPAMYGGSAGAVLNGQTRQPAAVPHGEANLRLIDAGALLESPFGEGRGSALVAGRYGYPGLILSAVTSTVRLGYWDYQTRVSWKLSARDTIGIFAFGSHDYLGSANTTNGKVGRITEQLSSDFQRVDLRYDHALADGNVRVAATFGYDLQGGANLDGDESSASVATIRDLSAALRLEADTRVSPTLRARGGASVHVDQYRFTQGEAALAQNATPQSPLSESADPPPTNLTFGAHGDVVWRVAPRVELVPGARFDVFESARANGPNGALLSTMVPAFDPRLALRVTVTPAVMWLASFGISHQYPALRVGGVPAILLSVPGFPVGDSQLQTVAQASQGVEVALPADFTLSTTGFVSRWSGLTDLTSNCLRIMPPTSPPQANPNAPPPEGVYTCPANQPVHGVAYGVELLLRRPLSKRLSGWLSYTLSRSQRTEHFITLSGGDARATVASDFDRTHVLNAILAYDLGRRWRAGGRFVFLSGAPYSKLSGNVPVPPYNAFRDPPFYRVDVRLEKRWALGENGYIAFIAEGQNVTLNKELTTFGLDCTGMQGPQGGTNQCTHAAVGPITLPSLGVEASF